MATTDEAPPPLKDRARASVQRFGGYLSAMVMPNIGAFIAFGLFTAIFLPKNDDGTGGGWFPDDTLGALIGPMINWLLPLLIAYTGGHLVHGQRGGVVGAIGAVGAIVASPDSPMFLGAMVMGPLSAFAMKTFDSVVQPRIRPGFEMLVNNFSAGILGGIMAVVGQLVVGPVILKITAGLGAAVGWLVEMQLIPLVSLFIEPAKVLFLNNAINHGVLSPLGIEASQETGRAMQFLFEANPGPGLGILLASWFFGPKISRATAPGAVIIHFFGGIHEIYFPYILAQPKLILAAIAGGMAGVTTLMITGAGLVAPASPGSIIAIMLVTPKGAHVPVLAAVLAATLVSFLVASLLLGFGRSARRQEQEEEAAAQA